MEWAVAFEARISRSATRVVKAPTAGAATSSSSSIAAFSETQIDWCSPPAVTSVMDSGMTV